METATLSAQLAAIVGAHHVHAADRLADRDTGFHPENFDAGLAVYPATTGQVAQVVALCARHRIPIVTHGGLTGLSGGAASQTGNVILGLRRMDALLELDPLAGTVVVEAGAILETVERAANEHGLSIGIDLGARGTATIGGMIATNAGGMEAFRNGSMRSRLLGIEAVTPNGAVLNDLTEVPKCNEGYDLKHLFCGAEGTLGIVTRAVLRLTPATAPTTTLLIAVDSAASALTITRACASAPAIDLLQTEIMWRNYATTVAAEIGLSHVLNFCDAPAYLLIELSATDPDAALDTLFTDPAVEAVTLNAVIAKNEKERAEIWRIREESFIVDNTVPHCQWYDISVPLSRIDGTITAIDSRLNALDPTLGIWVMGHLGDGNLHYTIGNGKPQSPERQTAEKRASLAKHSDPEKLRLMRAIKAAFDPDGIMNPGKVL